LQEIKSLIILEKNRLSSLDSDQNLERILEDMMIRRPDQLVTKQNDTEILFELLDKLSESDRDIITMRYLQELEYSEIAKITGKDESAIRTDSIPRDT
jgi:RNA polymerase sigma factor (sigma-70 family)